MPVVVHMKSGQEFVCDRRFSTFDVQLRIKEGQEGRFGALLALDDNRTPSRTFYIDPNEVESVRHDGYDY